MKRKLLIGWFLLLILSIPAVFIYQNYTKPISYTKETGINGYTTDEFGLAPSFDEDAIEPLSKESIEKYRNSAKYAASKGRLIIPTAGIDLYVFEGINNEHLMMGVGEQEPRTVVSAGSVGNYILAGHSSVLHGADFVLTSLNKTHVGDSIFVTDRTNVYEYRVEATNYYHLTDTYPLNKEMNNALITIYTCETTGELYPQNRFVVEGRLVSTTPIEDSFINI